MTFIPLPLGSEPMANSVPVTIATDDPVKVNTDTIAGSVETARTKVNPVVGQTGISAGAGAVAANTPRTTLASDDPLVAKVPAKGTAVMAGSMPVTVATDDTMMTSIKSGTDNIPAKGTALVAASTPVTIATDDGVAVNIGTLKDAVGEHNVASATAKAVKILARATAAPPADVTEGREALLSTTLGQLLRIAGFVDADNELRVGETNDLASQHAGSDGGQSIANSMAIVAAGDTYYPDANGWQTNGKTRLLLQLYVEGGEDAALAPCTNTVTVEMSIEGVTLGFIDVGLSLLDVATALNWAGSTVSTGSVAVEQLLLIGELPPVRIRLKSVIVGTPVVATPAAVRAGISASAL